MTDVKLPEPDTASLAYSGRSTDYINGYEAGYEAAASQLRQAVQEAVEAERRRCAELCEGLRDLREEARAILKASAALSEGDAAETLRRLRHESDVRLHNGALDRAAAAIRSGA
jgi:hypothetical protein